MTTNFTVRRPTPASNDSSDVDTTPTFKVPALPQHLRNNQRTGVSSPLNPNGKRALAFGDSDDEDDGTTDELVVSFDAMGAQRAHQVVKNEPLVIPSIPNKDWRAAARQRKGFKPDESKVKVGVDGSQGGMGTRDSINSGPQQSGLIVYKKRKIEEDAAHDSDGDLKMQPKEEEQTLSQSEDEVMTDEKRAVNALLAAAKQANEGGEAAEEMTLGAIVMPESADWRAAKSEAEAYRDDVATRPESASLEDYQRVPVSQFGTALLMGMGWKPGQGASKSGKGPVEAHAPKARPALLGLGAKPTDVVEDSKQRGGPKPSKKYVPVVAKEREGPVRDGQAPRSESRRSEREGDSRGTKDHREYDKSRDRSRDKGSGRDRSRSRDRRDRDRDYDRRDGHSGSSRRDSERRSESGRDRVRDDKHRDKDRDDSRRRR